MTDSSEACADNESVQGHLTRSNLSSVNEDETPTKKTPRKWLPRWREVPGFKDWIILDDIDLYSVGCKACNNKINSERTGLIKHVLTDKHAKNCKKKNIPIIYDFSVPDITEDQTELAVCEIKYAAMFCKYGLSFNISGPMAKDLANIDPRSKFNRFKIAATKMRDLTVKVISPAIKLQLATELKQLYFSLCLDESTDVSKEKVLDIVVRYPNANKREITSVTLDLAEVFEEGQKASCSAERIAEVVIQSFSKHKVPLMNIIACCTNSCSSMAGGITGLKARLQEVIPTLIWVLCAAHKTHHCAKHPAKLILSHIIQLVIHFHSMLNSSNKQRDFANLQKKLKLPIRRIPRFFEDRWLSLQKCADVGMEQWQALLEFSDELRNNGDQAGTLVNTVMKNPCTILYLGMLQHVLGILNGLNRFMQRSDPVNPEAKAKIDETYKGIVGIFMVKAYVEITPAAEINIFETSNYLPCIQFELGEIVKKEMEKMKHINTENFFRDTYQFIISICLEMQNRINFQDPLLTGLRCLFPENAVNRVYHENNVEDFEIFLETFKLLLPTQEIIQKVHEEWDLLLCIDADTVDGLLQLRTESFWFELLNFCDQEGEYPFCDLAMVANVALSVPHANADSERLFSVMNWLKPKSKNRSSPKTVDAQVRTREWTLSFDVNKGGCEPSKYMIDACLSRIYNERIKKESTEETSFLESTELYTEE